MVAVFVIPSLRIAVRLHVRRHFGADPVRLAIELQIELKQRDKPGVCVNTAVGRLIGSTWRILPNAIPATTRFLNDKTFGGELSEVVTIPVGREVHVPRTRRLEMQP